MLIFNYNTKHFMIFDKSTMILTDKTLNGIPFYKIEKDHILMDNRQYKDFIKTIIGAN